MAEEATNLDFYNTLLAKADGRKVLHLIRKTLITWYRKEGPVTAEEAKAQCTLDEVVMWLDEQCGMKTEQAETRMLEQMAVVAAEMLHTENKEPEKTDLHKIE